MGLDLSKLLMRKGLGRSEGDRPCCARCRRTPVPGELMHVFAGDRTLCALCVAELPEADREPLRRERVHAADRQLTVVRRAA